MKVPTDTLASLVDVLKDARALMSLPGNDFAWSSWEDASDALDEIDGLIAQLEQGERPERMEVAVLFLPTGPLQELSLSSGWAEAFLALAERYDAAEAIAWGQE